MISIFVAPTTCFMDAKFPQMPLEEIDYRQIFWKALFLHPALSLFVCLFALVSSKLEASIKLLWSLGTSVCSWLRSIEEGPRSSHVGKLMTWYPIEEALSWLSLGHPPVSVSEDLFIEISITHLGRLYLPTSFLGPEVAKELKAHHFIHRLTHSLFFQPRLCSHSHYVKCMSTGHD